MKRSIDSTISRPLKFPPLPSEPSSLNGTPNEGPHLIPLTVASEDRLRSRRIIGVLEAEGLPVLRQAHSIDSLCEPGDDVLEGVVVIASDISAPATVAGMRRVRAQAPEVRIVIVSASSHGNGVRRALNAAADGFVLESRLEETLACTVRAVHRDQVCAPRELRRWVAKPSFTHREKQILALLATGATNKEIANRLYLAESTVKSHLASLFGKLGVRSRKDAAAVVLDPEEGLQNTALPLDPDAILSLLSPNGATGATTT